MPSLSPTCIELVKNFEGYRAAPVRMPDGRWLIGYGHIQADAPTAPITDRDAEALLKEDLEVVAAGLRSLVMVQMSQCQFDGLCCFVYSIGLDAFETSDVRRLLNAGQPIAAACAMESWRMSSAGGGPRVVLDALVRRRAVEKSLFLYEGVRAPAASALIRPEVDPAIAMLASALPSRGTQNEDETARKLRDILAREPQTAGALQAMPEELQPMDDQPTPEKKAAREQRDLIGNVALGALGLLLIAMGVTGAGDDHGIAHVVFTVPGVIASIMSAYYLLKTAAH